jgi:hypothetical protein
MIGIVLVTHGRLAAEFRAALEHVVGPQKQIESITIGPDDDIEQRRQDIVSAVRNVDSGSGVVVFTDMFGGTPSNLAISIMTPGAASKRRATSSGLRTTGSLRPIDRHGENHRALDPTMFLSLPTIRPASGWSAPIIAVTGSAIHAMARRSIYSIEFSATSQHRE